MDYQKLLDYLGKLNEEERFVEIERMADDVYSNEFISLIKGQLQFAAKEMAAAGYFKKIYTGENENTLLDVQSDIRAQYKKNTKVWHSMIRLNNGFQFVKQSENTQKKKNVNHADEEIIFDFDYCLKCGLAGGSDVLCDKCLIKD